MYSKTPGVSLRHDMVILQISLGSLIVDRPVSQTIGEARRHMTSTRTADHTTMANLSQLHAVQMSSICSNDRPLVSGTQSNT